MRLLVIRHSETINNTLHIVQGITDSELTLKGIEDAKKLREIINQEKIDYVVSSPLGRTRQTAKILVEDKPINIDDRLKERNWGLCEQVDVHNVDRILCWNYYINTNDNQIEPVQDFVKRIRDFLWDLRLKHQNDTVLVVTHSAVSRAIYYIINGIPEDGDMSKIKIPNLEIMEYHI